MFFRKTKMPSRKNLTTIAADIKSIIYNTKADKKLGDEKTSIQKDIVESLQDLIKDNIQDENSELHKKIEKLKQTTLKELIVKIQALDINNQDDLQLFKLTLQKYNHLKDLLPNDDSSKKDENVNIQQFIDASKSLIDICLKFHEAKADQAQADQAQAAEAQAQADQAQDKAVEAAKVIGIDVENVAQEVEAQEVKAQEVKTQVLENLCKFLEPVTKVGPSAHIENIKNFTSLFRDQGVFEDNDLAKKIDNAQLFVDIFKKDPTELDQTQLNIQRYQIAMQPFLAKLKEYENKSPEKKQLSLPPSPPVLDQDKDSQALLGVLKLFKDSEQSNFFDYETETSDDSNDFCKHVNAIEGKKSARLAFLQHLNTLSLPTEKEALTMEELLGKEGVKLYKEALKEEVESKEFQTEFFNKSVLEYEGVRPEKKWDALILSGVSGAGKSSTGNYEISQMYPKDEDDPSKNKKFKLAWIDGGVPRDISMMQKAIKKLVERHGCNVSDMYDESKKFLDDVKKNLMSYVQKNPNKVDGVVITETFPMNLMGGDSKEYKETFKEIKGKIPKKDLKFHAAMVSGWDPENFEKVNSLMIDSRAFMSKEKREGNFKEAGWLIGPVDQLDRDFLGKSHQEMKANTTPKFIKAIGSSSFAWGLRGSQRFMHDSMDLDEFEGNAVFILNDLRIYDTQGQPFTGELNGNEVVASERVNAIWEKLPQEIPSIPFDQFANGTRTILHVNPQQSVADKITSLEELKADDPNKKIYNSLREHFKEEILRDKITEVYVLMGLNQSVKDAFVKEVFDTIKGLNLGDAIPEGRDDVDSLSVKGFKSFLKEKNKLSSFIPSEQEVFLYARKQLESNRVRVDKDSNAACYPFYQGLYQLLKLHTNKASNPLISKNNQPYLLELFQVLNDTNPDDYYSCYKAGDLISKILEKKTGDSKTAETDDPGKTITLLKEVRTYFEERVKTLTKTPKNSYGVEAIGQNSNLLSLLNLDDPTFKEIKRKYEATTDESTKNSHLRKLLEIFEKRSTQVDIKRFYQQLNPMAWKELNRFYANDPINKAISVVMVEGENVDEKTEKSKKAYFDYLNAQTLSDKNKKLTVLLIEFMKPREKFFGQAAFGETNTIKKLRSQLGNNTELNHILDLSLDYPIHKFMDQVKDRILTRLGDQYLSTPTLGNLQAFVERLEQLEKAQEFFSQLTDKQKILYHKQMGSKFVEFLDDKDVDKTQINRVSQLRKILPEGRFKVFQKLEENLKEEAKQKLELDLGDEFKEFKMFKINFPGEPVDLGDFRKWVVTTSNDVEGFDIKQLAKAIEYAPVKEENKTKLLNVLSNHSLFRLFDQANDDNALQELDQTCQSKTNVQPIQLLSSLQLAPKQEKIVEVTSIAAQ